MEKPHTIIVDGEETEISAVPFILKIEGREIEIPDDLIDMHEFIIRTIVMYPRIKCTGSVKNPFVFGTGELRKVVRTLSTYKQIQRFVERKNVKKDIANAVGQMFIREGASLELEIALASMRLQNNPVPEEKKDYLDELCEELGVTLDELMEMEEIDG